MKQQTNLTAKEVRLSDPNRSHYRSNSARANLECAGCNHNFEDAVARILISSLAWKTAPSAMWVGRRADLAIS